MASTHLNDREYFLIRYPHLRPIVHEYEKNRHNNLWNNLQLSKIGRRYPGNNLKKSMNSRSQLIWYQTSCEIYAKMFIWTRNSTIIPAREFEALKLSDKLFHDLQEINLKYHIKITKDKRNRLFREASRKKNILYNNVPHFWINPILRHVHNTKRIKCNNIQRHLDRKLNNPIRASPWSTSVNENCVINLSSKVLD